jgi:hypothetical protein
VRYHNNLHRRDALKAIGSGAAATTFGVGIVDAAGSRSSKDPILQASLRLMQNSRQKEEKKLKNERSKGDLNKDRILSELDISPNSQLGRYLKSNSEALIERAAKERAVEKRIRFLNKRDRNAKVDATHALVQYPKESGSDDPTTMNIGENQVSCWIATGWSRYNGADEWVDCNYSISGSGGEDPKDVVTVDWPSGDFDLVENGAYSHNMGNGHLKASSFNYATWSFGDGSACYWYCDLDFTVGAHIERLASPGKVETTYQHGWGGCGELQLSVSYGNVTATPTCGRSDVKQLLRDVKEF